MTAKAAEGIIDTQFGKILAAKQGTKGVTLESAQNNIDKQLLMILSFCCLFNYETMGTHHREGETLGVYSILFPPLFILNDAP